MNILFKNRITQMEGELAQLRAELEKAKVMEREHEDARRAMLFMLEDLNESASVIEKAKSEWETAFDGIEDPLFIHDREFKIVKANKAYQRYAGRPFKEIIGMTYYEIFPKMDGPFKGCLDAVESQDSGGVEELPIPSLDKIFKIRFYAVKDTDKNLLFSIHVMEDITEQKRAEEKIAAEMEMNTHLLMIAEATARTTNVEKLIDQVISCTQKITGSHICLSYLWDKDTMLFRPHHSLGLDAALTMIFKTEPLSETAGFVQKAMKNRRPFMMRAGAASEDEAELSHAAMYYQWMENDIHGIVILPLMGRDDNLGLLVNIYTTPRKFSEKDKQIFQGIASQVSTALEEARLYKESIERAIELSRRIETIQAMHEIDRGILSTLDRQEILETVARIIPRVIQCDRVSIVGVDKEKGRFVYKAGFGIKLSKGSYISFTDTSATEVVRTGLPQIVSDIAMEKKLLLTFEKMLLDSGFHSQIRVPVVVNGENIAVLNVGSKQVGVFTADHLSILEKLATQIGVALENARLLTDIEALFLGTIKSLSSAIDAKSPWTAGHSERVTKYALDIARMMGLDEKRLKDIEMAGLLHDIGKLGTYESILDKPGKLTDEEMALIKKHPAKGAEILAPIKQLKDIIPAIKHHHEFYDGDGYPDGLKGESIPLMARILKVADTIDAMGSDRPYREKLSMKAIIAELKKFSGSHYDPTVVEAFLKTIQK